MSRENEANHLFAKFIKWKRYLLACLCYLKKLNPTYNYL